MHLTKTTTLTCLITLTLIIKRGFGLVKRLRKNYEPVATLYADDDLKITPVSKAETLNQQVFTKEDNNTPLISSPQFPNIPDVIFTTNGIQNLLEDLIKAWQSCRS